MSSGLEVLLDLFAGARVFDLEQPRKGGDPVHPPHWPGFHFQLTRHHEPGPEPRSSASGFVYQAEHSGTHIDAFAHQAEAMKMFGDIAVDARVQTFSGLTRLGVETILPIFRRGVLLDVAGAAGARLRPGQRIGADELASAAAAGSVTLRPGDVALVRLGWGSKWDHADEYLNSPGMDRGASEWLADQGAFAVGVDNMAWDVPGYVDEVLKCTLPGHVILLVRRGVYIVENLILDELAKSGAAEFLFVCLPLKVLGGTASSVRPVAVVPRGD